MPKVVFTSNNSIHGRRHHGEDYQAEKLHKNGKLVLKRSTPWIISVTHSSNDCEDPVGWENVKLVIAHIVEIFICVAPWQIALLVVDEIAPTQVDPDNTEIVEQHKDLA